MSKDTALTDYSLLSKLVKLTPDEFQFIRCRYNNCGRPQRTIEEVANDLNRSRESVVKYSISIKTKLGLRNTQYSQEVKEHEKQFDARHRLNSTMRIYKISF